MTDLNSVLVSGEVTEEPFPGGGIPGEAYEWVAFRLRQASKAQDNLFSILVQGDLMRKVRGSVHKGDHVEIVGRLVGVDPYHMVIHAGYLTVVQKPKEARNDLED